MLLCSLSLVLLCFWLSIFSWQLVLITCYFRSRLLFTPYSTIATRHSLLSTLHSPLAGVVDICNCFCLAFQLWLSLSEVVFVFGGCCCCLCLDHKLLSWLMILIYGIQIKVEISIEVVNALLFFFRPKEIVLNKNRRK